MHSKNANQFLGKRGRSGFPISLGDEGGLPSEGPPSDGPGLGLEFGGNCRVVGEESWRSGCLL